MSYAKFLTKNGIRQVVAGDGSVWRRSDGSYDWVRSDADTFYVLEKWVRCPEKNVEDTGWYLFEDRDHPDFRSWCAPLLLEAVDVATEMIEAWREAR